MKALVAIGLMLVIVGIFNSCFVYAGSKPYLDNEEIQETAKSLESAGLLQDDISSEAVQKRAVMQYNYARPPKSIYAADELRTTDKAANDYKFKAYEYVQDNRKGKKNWFTNIKNVLGPMLPMKSLAKKYPFLQEVNARYETQAKWGTLTNDDVDCDVTKFKLTQLYNIFFVLQTDIKYLIIGDQHILNRAIYEQLKADKFSSPHNFYETYQLNPRQKSLLERYYSDHVNLLVTNMGDSVDHFYNPGEFVIGRILDSCQAVNQYQNMWQDLESNRMTVCSLSKSDPNQDLFVDYYNKSKYEDITALCHGLFEAL